MIHHFQHEEASGFTFVVRNGALNVCFVKGIPQHFQPFTHFAHMLANVAHSQVVVELIREVSTAFIIESYFLYTGMIGLREVNGDIQPIQSGKYGFNVYTMFYHKTLIVLFRLQNKVFFHLLYGVAKLRPTIHKDVLHAFHKLLVGVLTRLLCGHQGFVE